MTKAESKTATVGGCSRTSIPVVQSAESNPKNDVPASPISCSASSGQKGEPNGLNSNADNGVLSVGMSGSSIGRIENETKNLRISSDGHRSQLAWQHHLQSSLHSRGSSFQVQSGQSQTNHGMHHSSNLMDHFSHGQPRLPSSEVQPALVSTGVAPALYATAAGYGAPYYPSMQPSSPFPPQFTVGGYALNTSLVPPFITGYSPYSAIPMPLENPASPSFAARPSGVSTGSSITPIADMQNLYKFYGQFGVATQPSFQDPVYMSYFQHPSVDPYVNVGQYDPIASGGSTFGSPLGNYDPQRGQTSVVQAPDQSPHALRTGSTNIPGARKGGNASPNYPGSPQNIAVLMHYPTSPLGSPVYQGSPMAAASPSGRRNENIRFPINSARTGGAYSGWQGNRGREKVDDQKPSFLEELKSSKSRGYKLSDIAGCIVEFRQDYQTISIYSHLTCIIAYSSNAR